MEFAAIFARLLKKRLRRELAVDPEAGFDSVHNFAAQETALGELLWIHRKGATFAGAGALGVIPGSMATGAYLVRGLGNLEALSSCSHGAGRVMSRGQAARSITLDAFAIKMRGIVADTGRDLLDEAPQAYKDLDTVIGQQADLVTPIGRLLPLLNLKGGGRGREGTDPRGQRATPPHKDRTRDKESPLQRRKLAQRGRR
jgi:tRNA-splicing ligase RtcB